MSDCEVIEISSDTDSVQIVGVSPGPACDGSPDSAGPSDNQRCLPQLKDRHLLSLPGWPICRI